MSTSQRSDRIVPRHLEGGGCVGSPTPRLTEQLDRLQIRSTRMRMFLFFHKRTHTSLFSSQVSCPPICFDPLLSGPKGTGYTLHSHQFSSSETFEEGTVLHLGSDAEYLDVSPSLSSLCLSFRLLSLLTGWPHLQQTLPRVF